MTGLQSEREQRRPGTATNTSRLMQTQRNAATPREWRVRIVSLCLLSGCVHCTEGAQPAPPSGTTLQSGGSESVSSSGGHTGDMVTTGGASPGASGGLSVSTGGATLGGAGPSEGSGGEGAAGGGAAAGTGGDPAPGTGPGKEVPGDRCSFSIAHEQSSAIATVAIVTWSTDLPGLSEAHIDFGLVDSDLDLSAPVNLQHPALRTLLLGMKAARDYRFRIVASNGTETCTSEDLSLTTGPLPANVPVITKPEAQPGGVRGFFVTTPGIKTSADRGLPGAYVFDTDGDVVWWTPDSVEETSAARISWDGNSMWFVHTMTGPLRRTSMDGLTTSVIPELVVHHDLSPLPEGGVATFARRDGEHFLVEVSDSGVVNEVARIADLYDLTSYHPNAIHYHPSDDTYTISDRQLDGFVKVSRHGELLWQLGGSTSPGGSFELIGIEPWQNNHGHHLGPNGQFLFYENSTVDDTSSLIELSLDESAWTATKTWEYAPGLLSSFLSGAQRLPNGNYCAIHSMAGRIEEVTATGTLVQSFDNSYSFEHDDGSYALFGYATFRPTLYGPPQSTWPE